MNDYNDRVNKLYYDLLSNDIKVSLDIHYFSSYISDDEFDSVNSQIKNEKAYLFEFYQSVIDQRVLNLIRKYDFDIKFIINGDNKIGIQLEDVKNLK